jgi:gliding motility-associated lipoprotein GldB
MKKELKLLIYILLGLMVLAGCIRNPLKIDVTKIDIDLRIGRLDQDLAQVNRENIDKLIPELQKKYNPFFEVYNREILGIGGSRDSLYNTYLLTFLKDSAYTGPQRTADSVFSDFHPYFQQLEQAFKHYKYYYPEFRLPSIFTYLSGINQSIVTTPDALGISLDKYLGTQCRFYRLLGQPEYKRRNMHPQKMVYDAVYGWASQQFEYKGNTENLISAMIHQGKLLYFVDAMIPEGPDSLKIGYTGEQLKWCKVHEAEMWSFLIEKKMLFSGDRMELVRFINPAPFTTPFGQKSPGRTGVWIGWQVVKSYLKKNPKVSLKMLMEENDYHRILNDSGYSPD